MRLRARFFWNLPMIHALWYYASADRQRHGPVDAGNLADLLRAGRVSRDSLVWRQGMPEWLPLQQMAHELGLFAPARENEGFASPGDGVDAAYAASVGVNPEAPGRLLRDGPVVYAGFLKRFAAIVVDSVIVGFAGGVLGGMLGAIFGVAAAGLGFDAGAASMGTYLSSTLVGVVLGLLYYGGFHASKQQATPGKMLIGIKVARVDGDRLSPVRAGARFLATYLNLLTFGIGWLIAAFTDRKQALHDFIADTVVVDRWAFTESPERQNASLGGCAIAIIAVSALLLLGSLTVIVLAASQLSGRWIG